MTSNNYTIESSNAKENEVEIFDDIPTDEPVLEVVNDPTDPFHHSKLITVVPLKHGAQIVTLVNALAKLHMDEEGFLSFISLYTMPTDKDGLDKLITQTKPLNVGDDLITPV